MKSNLELLCKDIMMYFMTEGKPTIRNCAEKMGISKTYTHTIIHKYIKEYNYAVYDFICKILKENYDTKHIYGGKSTKQYWQNKRSKTMV